MTTLADYETQVADDLLHDPLFAIWSQARIDRYINEARRQVVIDTGCLRTLQTLYLSQGAEQYVFGQVTGASITAGGSGYTTPTVSFSGGGGSGVAATLGVTNGAVTSISFTSFGVGYTSAPTVTVNPVGGGTGAAITAGVINANTYDCLDLSIFFGALRYQVSWSAYSKFSRLYRANVGYQSRPVAWAFYGEVGFYVGPIPDQTYQAELDSVILPTDLSGGTVDVIPAKYTDLVQFYAAFKAKSNLQQFGEAETFKKEYDRLLVNRGASYVRRMGNPYLLGAN